jgi:hypothetical protein
MCGRYRRKSDKQRIADAFDVSTGLDELDLAPEEDIAPGSIQPVVSINQHGERQIELMRWDSSSPTIFSSTPVPRGSRRRSSGRTRFRRAAVSSLLMPSLNGSGPIRVRRSRSMSLLSPARNLSGWPVYGNSGRTPKQIIGSIHLPLSPASQMNSCYELSGMLDYGQTEMMTL